MDSLDHEVLSLGVELLLRVVVVVLLVAVGGELLGRGGTTIAERDRVSHGVKGRMGHRRLLKLSEIIIAIRKPTRIQTSDCLKVNH